MIFVDSNIPMYLIGAPHPNKDRAILVLSQLARNGEELVTNVEVFQEILHRYTAINRLDSIDPAFDTLESIVNEILAFELADIRAAKLLMDSVNGLSARDAVRVATMRRAGINRIFSFDRGFDACPGVQRVS